MLQYYGFLQEIVIARLRVGLFRLCKPLVSFPFFRPTGTPMSLADRRYWQYQTMFGGLWSGELVSVRPRGLDLRGRRPSK